MEYTVKLEEQDFRVLSVALAEMPYRLAAPLIMKINQQVASQQKPAEQPKEEADK